MATMVLNCSIESQGSAKAGDNRLLPLAPEVYAALYGQTAPFYLQVNQFK